ncbi:4-(cytidine 5'-diphospho)-2-C-methyl-D-erythritol kinase [Nocardioides sp.]|uniref:4-(cytidine 5'-diphospho)-2-C-methyl-D-erythritol kinase n=1 Tax=Nocardioides sp. TaxID=35761 RepID=UPI002722CCCE|nr:4-(cytidine 5'-diphospho)-2-C-methyl-D-erythritol kinase [Nocardioides sp.]MDO9457304.1 4-(cytidine 5'-diphospho)-2-C-methyl-D-erythritol kinase [Nocardioides sp.]
MPTPTAVTVRAAAKINLHLGVGAPRDDGFHPLTTVYQAVGLCDDVTAHPADDLSVDIAGADWVDADAIPTDSGNLAHRAGVLLGDHHGRELGARLVVEKSIPVAGGLAGGSADAAAALVALDRLHDLGTSDTDLLRIAARLGSDVPFALLGGTALGTGRGEVVEPVADVGTWWWVMVPSLEGLSTPAVYRHFDQLFPDASPTPPDAEALLGALRTGQPVSLARALRNDLQEPAIDLRPELGRLIEHGESEGALRGIVSGSGPTVVFLCESADHARDLAGALMRTGSPVVLVANGAVAGSHVVPAHV